VLTEEVTYSKGRWRWPVLAVPRDTAETHLNAQTLLILFLTLKGILLHNVLKQTFVPVSGRQALVFTPLVPRVNAPKIRATYFVSTASYRNSGANIARWEW